VNLPVNQVLAHRVVPEATLVAKPSIEQAIEEVCRARADAVFAGSSAVSPSVQRPNVSGQAAASDLISELRTRLGIGSTSASAAADQIREGISAIAKEGDCLGLWRVGFSRRGMRRR
jgi:hypothetical protein